MDVPNVCAFRRTLSYIRTTALENATETDAAEENAAEKDAAEEDGAQENAARKGAAGEVAANNFSILRLGRPL